jgi:hypothetical protein
MNLFPQQRQLMVQGPAAITIGEAVGAGVSTLFALFTFSCIEMLKQEQNKKKKMIADGQQPNFGLFHGSHSSISCQVRSQVKAFALPSTS